MYRYDTSTDDSVRHHPAWNDRDPAWERGSLILELAIPGLLEGQAMHGYEIRKRLRDELEQFSNVSFGSLYPALSRLERFGSGAGDRGPGRTRSDAGPHDGLP